MYYKGMTPSNYLSRFGINFNQPTVRDAVAFDLVKLDDGSVSNDTKYTFNEHVGYSAHEYDRMVLNRNFRIHLSNDAPEWSEIEYGGSDDETSTKKVKRTIERMYQGVWLSETLMQFFDDVYNEWYGADGHQNIENVYVPFTNSNDFITEITLIPNTHPDFRPTVTRAYYDKKYIKYRKMLKKWGIRAISTFALVDPDKDKNHTGQFLVKV